MRLASSHLPIREPGMNSSSASKQPTVVGEQEAPLPAARYSSIVPIAPYAILYVEVRIFGAAPRKAPFPGLFGDRMRHITHSGQPEGTPT